MEQNGDEKKAPAQNDEDYLKRVEAKMERVPQGGPEFGLESWARSTSGGLRFIDEAEMAKQKSVLAHLVKSLGSNIIQGKSVVNVSLPVRVFEPRSVLERITDGWCYAPLFLTKAAVAKDPLERFKWCMTFLVSGLHQLAKHSKPFNPILGETYQGYYRDGTQVFVEQISHHPPVSQFQVIGPDTIFMLHGAHEFAASMRPNSINGHQIGPTHAEFRDGTKVTYSMPQALLKGMIFGERHFNWQGVAKFEDAKNNLYCELVFDAEALGTFQSLFSSGPTPPADLIKGEIYKKVPLSKNNKTGREVIALAKGSWLDGISFDDVVFWAKDQIKPFVALPTDDPLPSDSRFREDLMYLSQKNEEEAQKWKSILEERQRSDQKLRKQLARPQDKVHVVRSSSSRAMELERSPSVSSSQTTDEGDKSDKSGK